MVEQVLTREKVLAEIIAERDQMILQLLSQINQLKNEIERLKSQKKEVND